MPRPRRCAACACESPASVQRLAVLRLAVADELHELEAVRARSPARSSGAAPRARRPRPRWGRWRSRARARPHVERGRARAAPPEAPSRRRGRARRRRAPRPRRERAHRRRAPPPRRRRSSTTAAGSAAAAGSAPTGAASSSGARLGDDGRRFLDRRGLLRLDRLLGRRRPGQIARCAARDDEAPVGRRGVQADVERDEPHAAALEAVDERRQLGDLAAEERQLADDQARRFAGLEPFKGPSQARAAPVRLDVARQIDESETEAIACPLDRDLLRLRVAVSRIVASAPNVPDGRDLRLGKRALPAHPLHAG